MGEQITLSQQSKQFPALQMHLWKTSTKGKVYQQIQKKIFHKLKHALGKLNYLNSSLNDVVVNS